MKLFYAEVHFKNSFYPWSVHRKGFTKDIPCMDSVHLFSDRSELEAAIQSALEECGKNTVSRVDREEIELFECRECGREYGFEDMMDAGECYPCYHAAAMGGDE